MTVTNIQHVLRAFPLIAFALLISSCTKDFEKINQDPTRPSTVNQGNLLGQLEYQLVNASVSISKGFNHELMQVTAPRESSSGGVHRYLIQPANGTSLWNGFYERIPDINDLEKISENSFPNYRAIALVLKAYTFSVLTDAFGPIPFAESGKAEEGIVAPKFDQQKAVYEGLFAMLAQANDLIDTDGGLAFGGDLIYGDDSGAMLKWKKFANSLRLRLLLRSIHRDGELPIKSEIETMLADRSRYPMFESNADEAILQYTGSYPYYNPYYNARTLDWRLNDYYTSFFLDPLLAHSDPRLRVWATTVLEDGEQIYRGIESGYTSDVVYVSEKNSSYHDNMKTTPILGILMGYAEVEFMLAELALRGYQTGATTEQHYQKGIGASMEQWQVRADESFFQQEGIRYDSTQPFEQQLETIMTQKYYSLFFVNMQSWFEKRRTGYPVLPRGNGIPAENMFPSRLLYPTYLQSLNPESLSEAITALGGKDASNIVGWWEHK